MLAIVRIPKMSSIATRYFELILFIFQVNVRFFFSDSDHPHAFLGRNRRGVRNPPGSVVDVDDRIDYLVAEAMQSERRA